jgi:hypothetical protein
MNHAQKSLLLEVQDHSLGSKCRIKFLNCKCHTISRTSWLGLNQIV